VVGTRVATTIAGNSASGFVDATGVSAKFDNPAGIAFETRSTLQYLFVADRNNHRIRRILLTTRIVSTVAGSGAQGSQDGPSIAATFSFPQGLTWGPVNTAWSNTLFVSQGGINGQFCGIRAVAVTLTTFGVSTIAGGSTCGMVDGNSTSAQFNGPDGLASAVILGIPYLFVSDTGNNLIRLINLQTRIVTSLAGSSYNTPFFDGISTIASFNSPASLTIYSINDTSGQVLLHVADSGNHVIRLVTVNFPTVCRSGFICNAGAISQFGVACPPGMRGLFSLSLL
jgi:hypothetical protein